MVRSNSTLSNDKNIDTLRGKQNTMVTDRVRDYLYGYTNKVVFSPRGNDLNKCFLKISVIRVDN